MTLIHETDYGTPASRAEARVTLSIDGRAVTVPAGTSVMRAAMEAGTRVPKLCATDSVDASIARRQASCAASTGISTVVAQASHA